MPVSRTLPGKTAVSEQPAREDSPVADATAWVSDALDGIAEAEAAAQLQRLREVHARLRDRFARIKDA